MAGAGTYSFHNDAVQTVNSSNILSWALLLLIVLQIIKHETLPCVGVGSVPGGIEADSHGTTC